MGIDPLWSGGKTWALIDSRWSGGRTSAWRAGDVGIDPRWSGGNTLGLIPGGLAVTPWDSRWSGGNTSDPGGLAVRRQPGERETWGLTHSCSNHCCLLAVKRHSNMLVYLRRDGYLRWSHVSDFTSDALVTTLPGVWRCKVSSRTGWPSVRIL